MPNLSEENLTISSSHYELENSYLTGSLLSCPPLLPPKKKKFRNVVLRFMNSAVKRTRLS